MRGPLDQAAERAPRAVLRQQLVGVHGVLAHPGHAVPGRAGRPDQRRADPQCTPLRSRRLLQASCRHARPVLDLVSLASGQVVRRQRQAQGGGGRDLRVREPIEPATHRCLAAMALVVRRVRPDQLAGLLDVPCRDGVRDRPIEVALLGVPPACPRVELGFSQRSEAVKLGLEHLVKQRVVAILLVSAVQWDEEEVRAREPPQRLRRSLPLKHRVAQWPREPVEDRR